MSSGSRFYHFPSIWLFFGDDIYLEILKMYTWINIFHSVLQKNPHIWFITYHDHFLLSLDLTLNIKHLLFAFGSQLFSTWIENTILHFFSCNSFYSPFFHSCFPFLCSYVYLSRNIYHMKTFLWTKSLINGTT